MTDAAPTPNLVLFDRFAALVARAVEPSTDAQVMRAGAREVLDATQQGAITIGLVDGALQLDGAQVESPVLLERFTAHGIVSLGITAKAAQSDLLDLVRLLAGPPGEGDAAARFAARATVIDAKAFPRTMRVTPGTTEPAAPAVSVAPVAEAAPDARPPRPSGSIRRVSGAHRRTPRSTPAILEAIPALPPEPRDAPVRLEQALDLPTTNDAALRSAITALSLADDLKRRTAALEQLVAYCDLAFRQGRHDALLDGLTALFALEFSGLAADATDDKRQAFNHAVRRLARPVLLRQLAVLRHTRAADEVATARIQQALYRFGIDAVEALLDECLTAPSPEARAQVVESLRWLPRAHEALRTMMSSLDDVVMRQAVAIHGELRDPPSLLALEQVLEHPEPRTRRAVVAALARFEGEAVWEALAFALEDESAPVRQLALSALVSHRHPGLLALLAPLLEEEPDKEVLFAAIGVLGTIGGPDAVNILIPMAQGDAVHELADTAAFRIQACMALVAIRTPTAMAAVGMLREDRDREVRQASMRLVAHARRRPTTGIAAVVAG